MSLFKLIFVAALVAAAAVLSNCQPQDEDDTTAWWHMYNSTAQTGKHGPKIQLKTFYDPVSKDLTLKFHLQSAQSSKYGLISGFGFNLITPELFCATEEECEVNDNLLSPNEQSYPVGKYYLWQASRTLLLSFTNKFNGAPAQFCAASILSEFCNDKKTCDILDWTEESDYTSNLKANARLSTTNVMNSLSVSELSSKSISDNRKRSQELNFTIVLKNNFFQTDSEKTNNGDDNTWKLGLKDGKEVYLGWRLWTSHDVNVGCTDFDHRERFAKKPALSQVEPPTQTRYEKFKETFVKIVVPSAKPTKFPTRVPTKFPTPFPTKKPTKNPTNFPTKKPTAPTPTKAPTSFPTKKPTKNPTKFPTKSPTTPKPTKEPTPSPTKKPTKNPTNFPTKKPTAPTPTKAPTTLACPEERGWELCQRINTWFKQYAGQTKRRAANIKRECVANGCMYCGYKLDEYPDAVNCRPKKNVVNRKYGKADICLADPDENVFDAAGCEMFPNCPTPDEMTQCRKINLSDGPRYKKDICENRIVFSGPEGQKQTIGKNRCAYNNGKCRAVGEYYWGRETVTNIPGYFGKIKKCPFA